MPAFLQFALDIRIRELDAFGRELLTGRAGSAWLSGLIAHRTVCSTNLLDTTASQRAIRSMRTVDPGHKAAKA